jgi:hypothetical protein
LPIEMLEFFILTPLPGSRDHQQLARIGTPMDPDMNKYDSEHVVTAHAHMSAEQLLAVYHDAWRRYYSLEHIETMLKRAMVSGASPRRVSESAFFFRAAAVHEKVHPLQSGVFRRKSRSQRRSDMPRENIVAFAWRRVGDVYRTYVPMLRLLWQIERLRRRVKRDPANARYMDAATTPVAGVVEDLELYRTSDAARSAADFARKKGAARLAAAS